MRRFPALAAATLAVLFLSGSGRGPEDPQQIAIDYLKHLGAGHPYLAVDACYDADAFAQRVFGQELLSLKPGEAAYVGQLASIILKAAATTADLEKHLKNARRSPFRVSGEGEEVRLSFTLALSPERENGPTHDTTLVLSRASGAWRIVDVEPLAATFAREYPRARALGGTPMDFMESAVVTMLDGKHKRTPSEAARDAKAGAIMTELDTLANQVELFKTREKRYPNFERGWAELLSGGYLKKPPRNPINNRSEIAVGKPRANHGWAWDPATGTLSACYFDEESGAITPGKP
ncbi:MAG: hypothetical protein WD749_09620 [Phycisphaerales bacterium]